MEPEVRERFERIEKNMADMTGVLHGLTTTLQTVVQAFGEFVEVTNQRMVRMELLIEASFERMTRIEQQFEASDKRMTRMEENLDILIRAITTEHGNGHPTS